MRIIAAIMRLLFRPVWFEVLANWLKLFTFAKTIVQMERIYLTKNEKQVMRWLRFHNGYKDTMPRTSFDRALRSLKEKDLAVGFWSGEAGLVEAFLTPGGEGYIEDNPKLRNPVDWKWVVSTAIALLTAIAAFAVLFISCSRIRG